MLLIYFGSSFNGYSSCLFFSSHPPAHFFDKYFIFLSLSVVVTNLQKRGGLDDEKYEFLKKRSMEVTHPLYSAMKVFFFFFWHSFNVLPALPRFLSFPSHPLFQECASPLDVAHLIGFLTRFYPFFFLFFFLTFFLNLFLSATNHNLFPVIVLKLMAGELV